MAKPKTKVERYMVSVTETQREALRALMTADMQENVSDYFGMMIAEITRRRASDNP